MSEREFGLRVEFESDWHVGAGQGRHGSLDRLVLRDSDGLPYVPGKTLFGIWRDAAEQLCDALGSDWKPWRDLLFGSQPPRTSRGERLPEPQPAGLEVRPARIGDALRAHLLAPDAQVLRSALTFAKPGVKIDQASGRADDKHLRFEEMARAGTVLEAKCRLDERVPEDGLEAAAHFLAAAAGLVGRLGGKRRRGAGRCTWKLPDHPVAAAADWLEAQSAAPPVPSRVMVKPVVAAALPSAPVADQGWRTLPLRITLQTPVVVPAKTVGNVVQSLDHVPGTYLLPLVTRVLEAAGVPSVREAVARGDVQVLPAYPQVAGERGRPTPLVLAERKDGEGFKQAGEIVNKMRGEELEKQEKQLRGGYLSPTTAGTLPSRFEVQTVLGTHNTVDDQFQRPTTEVGGVYSYEAIAAGTILRSEVRCRADVLQGVIVDWTALAGPARLGRSKKDDYGQVTIELAADAPQPWAPDWQAGANKVVLWLQSDLLLRDRRLRPDATVEALESVLRVKLGSQVGVCHAFVRPMRKESWQVGWGLPRPSLVGLAAGSCLEVKSETPLEATAVAALLREGLGERRAEGYGQLLADDPLVTSEVNGWAAAAGPTAGGGEASPPTMAPIAATTSDYEFAKLLETIAAREALREAALLVSNEPRRNLLKWTAEKPSQSQLGALRNVVRRVRSWDDRALLTDWLTHLKECQPRADGWPGGALPALAGLVANEGAVWTALGGLTCHAVTKGGLARLRSELWAEALRTLIDEAVRAETRQRERERPNGGKEGHDGASE